MIANENRTVFFMFPSFYGLPLRDPEDPPRLPELGAEPEERPGFENPPLLLEPLFGDGAGLTFLGGCVTLGGAVRDGCEPRDGSTLDGAVGCVLVGGV